MKLSKKILYIVIITIIVSVIIIFWFLFSSNKSVDKDVEFIKILDQKIDYLNVNNKDILYQDIETNRLYNYSSNKKESNDISEVLGGVGDVIGLNEELLIVESKNFSFATNVNPIYSSKRPDNSKNYWLYNTKTKKFQLLSDRIYDIYYNKTINKIVYRYLESEDNISISMSNVDGSDWKKLTEIDFYGQVLGYDSNIKKLILLDEDKNNILINQNNKSTILLKNVTKFSISPNLEKIIYYDSQSDNMFYLPNIKEPSKKIKLKFAINFEKVIWDESNNTIYMHYSPDKKKSELFKIDLTKDIESKLKLPEKNVYINDIILQGEKVYVATNNGLYEFSI